MQTYILQATGPSNRSQGRSQGQQPQAQGNILVDRIREIVRNIFSDVLSRRKPLVEEEIGQYNRQFIDNFEPAFTKSFGKNGSRIGSMTLAQLVTELESINKKIGSRNLHQGTSRLSKYSEWMDKLDCNEFYQSKSYIEIPGQYEGSHFHHEPQIKKNIKIASFKKVCLVLGSIRRPKKITVHGSNEKDYNLLVKGGEDLRLDQRVQQLFSIMNKIFATDPTCENRDLHLKTFGVVPISNRLATFEWVDNTEPMKAIISKEHKRQVSGKDIHESRAQLKRMLWLQNMPDNKKLADPSPAQLHQTLLKQEEQDVVQAFEEHQDSFPRFLLRNGLENLCLTSSAFLTIKNQFIKSIAVFSIASYLIGIGDRHLENFLIDTTDGEVLGIDFGIAFGSGVHLVIPELMPFRLTMQIEGVIAPHPLEGLYQQTMVHVLNAIRRKKGLILDTCDIFVKEPLLDWVQDARQRNRTAVASGVRSGTPSSALQNPGSGTPSSGVLDADAELTQLSWYPRQKIQIVREKLLGVNPVKILAKELRDSVHARKDYFGQITLAVRGPPDGCRYYHLAHNRHIKYLSAEHQVDILIELARDSNILGRTWIGWSPHI